MGLETTDQIAAEADAEITRIAKLVVLGCKPHTTVKAIVKSAIEKATKELDEELKATRTQLANERHESRAAQASESET